MNKKFLGIRIGTILSTLLCLIIAIVFWFFVEYSDLHATEFVESLYPDVLC